ncbi:MAG TPA: serine/threonine-protein kinase [Polyangia bacterium]|nr:serine/threonine-protein kinase [Polyangia bacterium]
MDPTSAAMDGLPPGTKLGRYEIRRLIGRGGMGSVYEALHRDLKKRVAIKTLLPALAANPDAKTRFLREGEAASRIRHPHVVDVTDVGAEGSVIYLVMEYLEGQDLGKLIASQGPLGIGEAADIMLPVAAAIATAHDQGVIHRDLKPENIFLAVGAMGGVQPKVLDFGISKVSGDLRTMALTGTGATFGTTFYLPPEQLRGSKQADARSDQYALGTILYECLTGQRAFEGENLYAVLKDIAESRYRPAASLRPDIPPALDAVVNRAMNLEPTARFDSVHSLGAALLEYAGPSARMVWTPFFGTARVVREAPVVSPSLNDESPRVDAASASGPLSARDYAATPPPRPTTEPPARRITAGGTRVLPADATPSPDGRSTGRPQRVESISTFRHATGESAMLGPRRSRLPLVVGLGVVAAIGAVFLVMRPDEALTTSHPTHPAQPAPEPKMFRVELVTVPSTATIELDGQVVGTGAFARRLPVDGSEHEVVAHARGYRNASVRFTDTPPPRDLALEAIAAPAEPARPVVPVTETKPIVTATRPDKPGHGHQHHGGKPAPSGHNDAASGGEGKPPASKPTGKPRSGDSGLLPNNAPIVE